MPQPVAFFSLTSLPQSRILRGNRRLTKEESMRVLAVEDEPEYLEMFQEVMQAIGHTIVIA